MWYMQLVKRDTTEVYEVYVLLALDLVCKQKLSVYQRFMTSVDLLCK